MKLRLAAGVLALMAAAPAFADPREFGVPEPHGWIGTTSRLDPGRRVSLFAALNLILLVWIWRHVRSGGVTANSKALLFGSIFVLPVIVVFLATAHGMQEAMTVESCGALPRDGGPRRGPEGSRRATRSPRCTTRTGTSRRITATRATATTACSAPSPENSSGLRHTYYNITGTYEKPIKIASPYPNVRCLTCHAGAQNFLAKHEKDEVDKLMVGKDSCLDCHGPGAQGRGARGAGQAGIPMRPDATPLPRRALRRLRLAILFTVVAVALGAALLIKETAIVFTTFMFLGPATPASRRSSCSAGRSSRSCATKRVL